MTDDYLRGLSGEGARNDREESLAYYMGRDQRQREWLDQAAAPSTPSTEPYSPRSRRSGSGSVVQARPLTLSRYVRSVIGAVLLLAPLLALVATQPEFFGIQGVPYVRELSLWTAGVWIAAVPPALFVSAVAHNLVLSLWGLLVRFALTLLVTVVAVRAVMYFLF